MCEQYFQVLPQIEGLTHCPIHGARFINSEVLLDRSTNYLIKPFHLVKVGNIEIADSSSIAVKLGKYIYDILNTSINGYKRALIGQFIREHIPNKYRVNRRGTQIRLEALKNDLDNYYEMLETYSLSKRQLARILNGESVNPFQICLIGFFINISPEEMVNRKVKQHQTLQVRVIVEAFNNDERDGTSYKLLYYAYNACMKDNFIPSTFKTLETVLSNQYKTIKKSYMSETGPSMSR